MTFAIASTHFCAPLEGVLSCSQAHRPLVTVVAPTRPACTRPRAAVLRVIHTWDSTRSASLGTFVLASTDHLLTLWLLWPQCNTCTSQMEHLRRWNTSAHRWRWTSGAAAKPQAPPTSSPPSIPSPTRYPSSPALMTSFNAAAAHSTNAGVGHQNHRPGGHQRLRHHPPGLHAPRRPRRQRCQLCRAPGQYCSPLSSQRP